jgi:hypothetical protein
MKNQPIELIGLMDHDLDQVLTRQRKGKPVEKRGRKVTGLKVAGLLPRPIGGWTASCSLNDNLPGDQFGREER